MPCNTLEHRTSACCVCIIDPSTAAQFLTSFSQKVNSESMCSDTNKLSSWFHSTCQTALETVAPLKSRQPKAKAWLNDTTHAVKHVCLFLFCCSRVWGSAGLNFWASAFFSLSAPSWHNCSLHCHADNTHIYVPMKQRKGYSTSSLMEYFEELRAWT